MSPIRKITSKPMGELLLERGKINKKQLNKALETQRDKGGLIGEILVGLGYASEEDIAQALTAQYGFPFLPLENYDIDQEVLKLLLPHLIINHSNQLNQSLFLLVEENDLKSKNIKSLNVVFD